MVTILPQILIFVTETACHADHCLVMDTDYIQLSK